MFLILEIERQHNAIADVTSVTEITVSKPRAEARAYRKRYRMGTRYMSIQENRYKITNRNHIALNALLSFCSAPTKVMRLCRAGLAHHDRPNHAEC